MAWGLRPSGQFSVISVEHVFLCCGGQFNSNKLTTDHCSLTTVFHQLDLITPGISPFRASARKHKRQTANFRRNPRGRPQSWQRLCLRLLNFGFRASFTRFAVVAIKPRKTVVSYQLSVIRTLQSGQNFSSARSN